MTPNDEPRGPERDRAARGTPVLPFLLIVIGALLLASQFGWIDWFDWRVLIDLAQLWPLALIALGIDILTRGRWRLWIVGGTLIAAVVAVQVFGLTTGGGPIVERAVAYDVVGVDRARVDLAHGVGRLEIGALESGDAHLVAGTLRVGANESVDPTFRLQDGGAVVTIRSRGSTVSGPVRGADRLWDLDFARDVPIDLRLDGGVGASRLDLRDLTLAALNVSAGVGEVIVDLPASGGYRGVIEAGVGEVTVRIPTAVEAHVEAEAGLGGVAVTGSWDRDGSVHRTAGYEDADAADRVDLRVSGGIGQIRVERVD